MRSHSSSSTPGCLQNEALFTTTYLQNEGNFFTSKNKQLYFATPEGTDFKGIISLESLG